MISEYKTEKKKSSKKILIPLFAVLLIGSVFAVGYLVNYFTLQVDVMEPFNVQYAILGDASNWNGVTGEVSGCEQVVNGNWLSMPNPNELPLDKDGLYSGEGRAVCFKIHNNAPVSIPFTISNTVTGGTNTADCVLAFGEHTLPGNAVSGDTVKGFGVMVNQNATPVSDCLININVARG